MELIDANSSLFADPELLKSVEVYWTRVRARRVYQVGGCTMYQVGARRVYQVGARRVYQVGASRVYQVGYTAMPAVATMSERLKVFGSSLTSSILYNPIPHSD